MSKRFGVSEQKWGDVGDFDEDSTNLERSTSGAAAVVSVSKPDAKGVKTVIEYGTNDKGEKIKITRKVKVVTKQTKVNKRVLARRKWAKFGDCKGVAPGPEQNVTYQSFEVINLDLRPKKREEEKEESGLDKLSGTTSIVVCRNCGETGHWTLKCPKRAELAPGGAKAAAAAAAAAASSADLGTGPDGPPGSKYVPVHMRGASAAGSAGGAAAGGDGRRGVSMLGNRDDTHTLRVTNLSEEVTEQDLQDLFRRFGHTQRIYLAKDRNTGQSRGFAFINYSNRLDAQNAIDKLNGHGYCNLILHVEWAKPREEKETVGTVSIGGGEDDSTARRR